MVKRKEKTKRKARKYSQKSYNLIQGNTNEFLLMFGGGAFVLFSVLYLLKAL